ncbi:MAG: CHAP domain-containing protein [Calothrix sp. SM1_5_4]|nr:CHAP domain-containing protein [Calothrix sp. SM1_5_4]
MKIHPRAGSIAIWNYAGTTDGHTGIVESADENVFTAFEGNTEKGIDPNGKIQRDGGGVYHTKRVMGDQGTMVLLGFLKPF